MKRHRKIKILATLGPSSFEKEIIRKLFHAGVDVFRINMSHTAHDRMRALQKHVREIEYEENHPIGILVDLQGPKLRIGEIDSESKDLTIGQTFILDTSPAAGDKTRACFPHPEIYSSVKKGHRLLLDDGRVELEVHSVEKEHIITKVISGKSILSKKGVSLPDTHLAIGALTEKDIRDMHAALEIGADWIALSFIQRPEDLEEARKIVGKSTFLMAKIEKPHALERLAEIIALSDGLMVARGDLGVEIPAEKVPGIQKHIIRKARAAGKPVVVATQILESMITAPTPTRAEVSDAANATFEGADALMLSAESASGNYPVEAVMMMNKIAEQVESDFFYEEAMNTWHLETGSNESDAIALAARTLCQILNPEAIITENLSREDILRIARQRPKAAILALAPEIREARKLSLVWGTYSTMPPSSLKPKDIADNQGAMISCSEISHQKKDQIILRKETTNKSEKTTIIRIETLNRERTIKQD